MSELRSLNAENGINNEPYLFLAVSIEPAIHGYSGRAGFRGMSTNALGFIQ
jgi:hypothetical protein